MRTTIDGKSYDTDTAALVAAWSNGRPTSDSRWCSETLYRGKGNGTFFLHGEGGALSRYSVVRDGAPIGIEMIIPCSRDEAGWWCDQTEQREASR